MQTQDGHTTINHHWLHFLNEVESFGTLFPDLNPALVSKLRGVFWKAWQDARVRGTAWGVIGCCASCTAAYVCLLQYCWELLIKLLEISLFLYQLINLNLCHALGLLCLSIALRSTGDSFTEALEQVLQKPLVFTSSWALTGCHGGDDISLFPLRLQSNNKPAILEIFVEAKTTINLKSLQRKWTIFSFSASRIMLLW